jgi:hypothetical protein
MMAALALLGGCAGGGGHSASRGRDAVAAAATFDEASGTYGDGAKKAGAAKDCVPISSIRATHVRSDRVIDFEMAGRETYRNTLPNPCPQLGFEERFAYATSINQLCAVDTITVLMSPGLMRGATCGLGRFQPITPRAK